MAITLDLDEIKGLINIPELIREIEAEIVLYFEDRVQVPPSSGGIRTHDLQIRAAR